MNGAPLLDTHAWVWWVDQDRRLGRRTLDALDALPPEARPLLCDISLWEVAMLVERGRLSFTVPLFDWLQAAAHPRTVHLISITPEIATHVAELPASFHRDPADRVIVAACRTLKVPIVTYDERIRRSRLVTRGTPPVPPVRIPV